MSKSESRYHLVKNTVKNAFFDEICRVICFLEFRT